MKFLLFLFFIYSPNSFSLTLPCPFDMMGEENRHQFELDIGPPDKWLHGNAYFRVDSCIIKSLRNSIIAHVGLWFDTDAVFTWKKKVLGVKVTKNFDLDCRFEILANASFEKTCTLHYADILFQKFKCRGIPKIFTQMFESKIQNLLNSKAREFLGNNLEEFINNNDEARDICL